MVVVVQRNVFIASDGSGWLTLAEAEKHEKDVRRTELVTWLREELLDAGGQYTISTSRVPPSGLRRTWRRSSKRRAQSRAQRPK